MKYEKPMAAIEHYALSQSIAACSIRIGLTNAQCVIKDSDTPEETRSLTYVYQHIYFTTIGGCSTDAQAMQGNDKLCYHTQVNAMFTS